MGRHEETRLTLGQFIRRRRRELGLTQEELAARVGDNVRQSDISRLERDGVSLPRRSRLEHIARALDVSLGALMQQTGWLDYGAGEAEGVIPEVVAPNGPYHPASAPVPDLPPAKPVPSVHQESEQHHSNNIRDQATALNNAISRAEAVRRQTQSILRQSSVALERARRTRGQE